MFDNLSLRKCRRCEQEFPKTEFIKDKRWNSYLCKKCNSNNNLKFRLKNEVYIKTYKSKYYELNKQKIKDKVKKRYWENQESEKQKHRERYAKNKDKYKDLDLKRYFGISLEDYKEILDQQKGVCAICNGTEKRSLSVDHCHKTGKIRGLLCTNCNNGIGRFKDNINFLENAIKYLICHT